MSRTVIVVDAACDLPAQFILEHDILVLPFNIETENEVISDYRDEQALPSLYVEHLVSKSKSYANSSPLSGDSLKDFFIEKVVTKYDKAIFLTIAASRSAVQKEVNSAWFDISTKCSELRRELGLAGRFYLSVVDTANIGPGQAVLAFMAAKLLQQGASASEIVSQVTSLRRSVFTYGIPSDLLYLYTRAKVKKENSISWGKYMIGNVLNLRPIIQFNDGNSSSSVKVNSTEKGLKKIVDHVEKLLKDGLLIPVVCVSYSGDIEEIERMAHYTRLRMMLREAGVTLFLVPMSLTVAVNFGAKALAISFAAKNSEL